MKVPADYVKVYSLGGRQKRSTVVVLNWLSLLLVFPGILLFGAIPAWIANAPIDRLGHVDLNPIYSLTVIAALILNVILHEVCHGWAIALIGGRPRYGLRLRSLAAYAASASVGALYTRRQFLAIALAPLLLLTPIWWALALLPLAPEWWLIVALCGILNIAGAVSDLFLAWQVWLRPREAVVVDEGSGLSVYVPALQAQRRAPHE
jgi:hypothetical protein